MRFIGAARVERRGNGWLNFRDIPATLDIDEALALALDSLGTGRMRRHFVNQILADGICALADQIEENGVTIYLREWRLSVEKALPRIDEHSGSQPSIKS